MARIPNQQKRGMELPSGCKDLVDVLKGDRKSPIPGTFTDKNNPSARSDLFPSGGIAHLERYVNLILVGSERFVGLTISSLDNRVSIGLHRQPQGRDFDLVLCLQRKGKDCDKAVSDLLARHGIEHALDDVGSGIEASYRRGIKYPLPADSRLAAEIIADLLRSFYGLDAQAGLTFAYHEILQ
jgi:hypothetical protein